MTLSESNHAFLENLLFKIQFLEFDDVSNNVIAAFIADELNLSTVVDLDELLPHLTTALESIEFDYDELDIDSCRKSLEKSDFNRALLLLNSFRDATHVLVHLRQEDVWLDASLIDNDCDLSENMATVLVHQFGVCVLLVLLLHSQNSHSILTIVTLLQA
jgi:hypothetical protein